MYCIVSRSSCIKNSCAWWSCKMESCKIVAGREERTMTIHTSLRGKLLVGYDRKTPRHNWSIIGSETPQNISRLRGLLATWEYRAMSHGWDMEKYQQCIVMIDTTHTRGTIPDSLPSRHGHPVMPQEHPRVINVKTVRQTCCKWCHDHNLPMSEVLDGELWCGECGSYH